MIRYKTDTVKQCRENLMRLSNDARRRRILLLSKRLDEYAAARRALLLQLVDLDVQASAAQLEHNTLHNLDAPASRVPDEVLAMIFEEAMHPTVARDLPYHFGVVVSHVTQRWRNVSISTPKLWNNICCIVTPGDDSPYPEKLIGRASTFISRARSLPLRIHIEGFCDEDISSNFLHLIGDHIERCHQLRILDGDQDSMARLLEVISPQSMPLLASVDLTCSERDVEFKQQLFPAGVPRLATATIDDPDILTIHFCLPAFQSLTSLQLRGLYVPNFEDNVLYPLFRDALMALPALRHLDLLIVRFTAPSSRLPILLPSIQHLHVEGLSDGIPYLNLDDLLGCIQAPHLVALSLSSWNAEEPSEIFGPASEVHFPSVRHFILADIDVTNNAPHLMMFAQAFPCVERLTFKPSDPNNLEHNIDHILGVILSGDDEKAGSRAHSGPLWPKLRSIALSTSREDLDVPKLKGTILKMQAAGHPIRKLMLPRELHPAMVEVGEIMELEDFYVDWPTPFNW